MDVTKILAQLKAEREQFEILQGEGHIERRGKPPSWLPPSNDPQTPPNTPAAAALSRTRRGNVWAVAGTGEEIERLRRSLGIVEPFPLCARYLQYRQMQSANAPGEPKLAMEFLRELEGKAVDR